MAELLRASRDRLPARSSIPRDVDGITPRWLTAVLGSTVEAAEPTDHTTGTTSRARIFLRGDDVPPSVFVKLAPTVLPTRVFVNLLGLGSTEVSFYGSIRPHLPIEAPRAYAALEDRRLGRFALVLEDLAARGVGFADVREPATADQADAVLKALARLHAAFWDSPRFSKDLAWVRSHPEDPNASLIRLLLRAAVGRVAKHAPGLVPQRARSLLTQRRAIESALARGPLTLLHGDPHLGNIYFDRATPGFLDWQVVRRGHGLRDVAYFLVLSVDSDVRVAQGRDLIRSYLDAFAAAGGPKIGFDEAWLRYRREAFYAWIAAAFTAGAGGLQAAPIAEVGLRRATRALQDLDTTTALDQLLD